jgi:tryptophan-rich sensory protein
MHVVQHEPTRLRALVNAGQRPGAHVAMGVALTLGAVLLSVLVARSVAEADAPAAKQPGVRAPRALFGLLWSPVYLALTLSGLRVWNAPPSPERNRALALWGLVQGFNALWMAVGPSRLGGQLTTGVATVGTAGVYAWQARKIDTPAATLANPYLGWLGLANVLSGQFGRRAAVPTLH